MHAKPARPNLHEQSRAMCLEDQSEVSMQESSSQSEVNVSHTIGKTPLLMKLSFCSSLKAVKHIAKVS